MRRGCARRYPVRVPAEDVLSQTVVFELLDPQGADRLWERLRPRWLTSIYKCGEGAFIATDLRDQEGDLATLLRLVQFWARDCSLGPIPFHIDGRWYVLDTKVPLWPALV